MSDEDTPASPLSDGAGTGWFAYAPSGDAAAGAAGDPVVTRVDLSPDEYAGPFRDTGGSLGDDFDELHRWTGISRELYDDVMAWNDDVTATPGDPLADDTDGLFTRQQDLLRRLGEEVHPGIAVAPPRSVPATQVLLSRLRDDEQPGRLVVDGGTGGPARVLPPVPVGLVDRVQAWLHRRASHATARPSDEVIFAWEDEGAALARDLQQTLGDDYEVIAR